MKTTKAESLAVTSAAWRVRSQVSRRLMMREHQRAGRAHGAAFGRGRDADEDRAEHQEDQGQRRHHHEGDLLREARQEADLEEPVADPVHHRDAEGEDDADEHRQHDVVGAARASSFASRIRRRRRWRRTAPPATGGRGCRSPRGSRSPPAAGPARFGKQHRHQKDIAGIEAGQHEAGKERALVHVADRAAELVGHDDQHQRGRNDLRQRARCGDHARGDAPVVAVAQHDRQRDQAHRDHRGRDHAGRRGQQRADEDHRIGEPAADRAEQLPDRVEQVLGHARSFENQAHEGEERNRQQNVVVHHAVDALGQRLQEVGAEQAELDADQAEDQAVGGERERDRIAEQQKHHERREHDRRHVVDQHRRHGRRSGLACAATERRSWPRRECARPPPPRRMCVPPLLIGIGNEAAHHRDALDELGDALEEQQHESDRGSGTWPAIAAGRPHSSTAR